MNTTLSRRIAAQYVFDREGLVFRDEDAPFINQLNYSFGLIKDGAVSGDHWTAIDAYKAFIARHPHILPVLSVGGWGADGFSQAAATQEGRALFVKTALDLIERHGFLGLDIDWEYPCRDDAGIAAKGEYVLKHGLMGLMCWEYGGDKEGELKRAMHASLNP